MHNARRTALVLLAAVLCGGAGEVERGRLIAVGGMPNGQHWACFRCHGLNGAGDGTGAFPRLAGQWAFYLEKQLKDFAAGRRPHEVMSPIAGALDDAAKADAAAWYASLADAPYPPAPAVDPAVLQRGGVIANRGLPERGVPACNDCHGAAGKGAGPSIPWLAGQYAPYLRLQLGHWAGGSRNNDPLDMMRHVATALTDAEAWAVALYYATARPAEVPADHLAGDPP